MRKLNTANGAIYFGDLPTQQQLLARQVNGINHAALMRHTKHGKGMFVPPLDLQACMNRLQKRVRKFYGLDKRIYLNK